MVPTSRKSKREVLAILVLRTIISDKKDFRSLLCVCKHQKRSHSLQVFVIYQNGKDKVEINYADTTDH